MMITERLLQYIWQFQYFNANELATSTGDLLVILYPGSRNTHQGPDFLEAKVRIGGFTWIGHIELHVNASDWHKHEHSGDPNYDNLILHVVWNDDDQAAAAGTPTLCLAGRIPGLLLKQYASWMNSVSFVPCGRQLRKAPYLVWEAWKERLMAERLLRKSSRVTHLLAQNGYSWQETTWWLLARSFGLQVNADAFETVARSLPYVLLLKHRAHVFQLEALLMGQAGLLEEEPACGYAAMLRKEYRFYSKKYGLKNIRIPVHFLRMRPAAFPTIRLAQLAMLIHRSPNPFGKIIDAKDPSEIRQLLTVTASDYWHAHFIFGEESGCLPKTLGGQMINAIIVNTAVPLLFAYGDHRGKEALKQRAITWLNNLPPERNSMLQRFGSQGIACTTAAASQAILELKQEYCDRKRCLDCAVGNSLLKRMSATEIFNYR